jgi:hypothetical protein
MSLTLKNYGMGLSKGIFDSNDKRNFMIKGPMGKGLGINEKSSGLHFAFAAGTGVLVFVDLIARMILEQQEIVPKKINSQFKLVFFASF